MNNWKRVTWDKLMPIINGATDTDCVVYEQELRIGTKEGFIRIPLDNDMEIYTCKDQALNFIRS